MADVGGFVRVDAGVLDEDLPRGDFYRRLFVCRYRGRDSGAVHADVDVSSACDSIFSMPGSAPRPSAISSADLPRRFAEFLGQFEGQSERILAPRSTFGGCSTEILASSRSYFWRRNSRTWEARLRCRLRTRSSSNFLRGTAIVTNAARPSNQQGCESNGKYSDGNQPIESVRRAGFNGMSYLESTKNLRPAPRYDIVAVFVMRNLPSRVPSASMLRRAAPRHQESSATVSRAPPLRSRPRRFFFIGIIASKARLATSPPNRQGFAQNPWRNLPGDAPFVLAPAALTSLPAIADNGVPVAVCFFLIVGRDLERKGLTVLEGGTAIETETRKGPPRRIRRSARSPPCRPG